MCKDPGMGQLHYGSNAFDFDDRTLLHLQTVITQKLRRHERFLLTFDETIRGVQTRSSIWISDNSPLRFFFAGSRTARVDSAWLAEMMHVSYSATGLDLALCPETVKQTA